MRAHCSHCVLDVTQCGGHLFDEGPTGIRQRNTSRGAIEQANAELPFYLANKVAERRRRQPEFERRRTERPSIGDGQNRFKFSQDLT